MRPRSLLFQFFQVTVVFFLLRHEVFAQDDSNSPDDDDNGVTPPETIITTTNAPNPPLNPATITSSAAATTASVINTTTASNTTMAVGGGDLKYVKNSGICETTPGVRQISGYINVSKDTHIWFWFFAARTNPNGAPLTIWVNGEPGCSSMAGLFQEHGPCTVDTGGSTATVNPHSWNSASNMIYIDLPAGAGFSYGPDSKNTFQGSAEQLWTALQVLFGDPEFVEFRERRLIFATEGFGARLAPVLVRYSEAQNTRIDRHEITGYKVVFSSIMVNNGVHDPLTQLNSFIKFCTRAPGYGRIQNGTIVNRMKGYMGTVGSCGDFLQQCILAGASPSGNSVCSNAWTTCESTVIQAAIGGRSATDLMRLQTDPAYPPTDYLKFLSGSNVMAKIGAVTSFGQCNSGIKNAFQSSGELARSSLPDLAELANGKFPILIWAGDLDISDNWVGVYRSMVAMDWFGSQMLNNTWYRNITLGDQIVARAKVVSSLSFARIYGAGHAVAAYQPWVALQIFQEFSQKDSLFYMLDQKEHRPRPKPHHEKNGDEGKLKHGGWLTVVSVLGAVAVAVL